MSLVTNASRNEVVMTFVNASFHESQNILCTCASMSYTTFRFSDDDMGIVFMMKHYYSNDVIFYDQ